MLLRIRPSLTIIITMETYRASVEQWYFKNFFMACISIKQYNTTA